MVPCCAWTGAAHTVAATASPKSPDNLALESMKPHPRLGNELPVVDHFRRLRCQLPQYWGLPQRKGNLGPGGGGRSKASSTGQADDLRRAGAKRGVERGHEAAGLDHEGGLQPGPACGAAVAWSYRFPHRQRAVARRAQPPDAVVQSWKAQHGLHQMFKRLALRKNSQIGAVTMAREPVGFAWAPPEQA